MADWKLVYQGGHHDVYCNGETHLTTSLGGWACTAREPHEARVVRNKLNRCDCARWVKKAS
jgi:hypothetical protein